MRLMVVYVVIVVLVELVAIRIGIKLDTLYPTLSVPMALGLFFGALGLGWPIAVFIVDRWLPSKSA